MLRASLALVVLSCIARAGVLVVGSGQPFTQLQPAIDAAQDGDVVLVKTGDYPLGFAIGDKSIAVVADTGADVLVRAPISVAGVSVTREVVIAGLRVIIPPGSTTATSACVVSTCAGSVRFLECEIRAAHRTINPCVVQGRGVFVFDSQDVAFTRCEIHGASATTVNDGEGGDGMHLVTSRVAVYDSHVEGGHGGNDTICNSYGIAYGDGLEGGLGAYTQDQSILVASGSVFRGGDGGDALPTGVRVFGGWGNSGIAAVTPFPSTGEVRLIATAVVAGAGGSVPPFPSNNVPGSSRPAHSASAGITYHVHPGDAHRLSAPRIARAGSTVQITCTGSAGDALAWFVSGRANWERVAGLAGVRLYEQNPPGRFTRIGIVPGSGTLVHSLTLGALPAGALSRVHHVQALSAAGPTLRLASGQPIVVIDPSF